MKLVEYADKKEMEWNKKEEEKVKELIEYLNSNINKDLFQIAKTDNYGEVFQKLKIWLIRFYNEQFLEGLKYIKVNYEEFKKRIIYSLILEITRNKSNMNVVYEALKSLNIVNKIVVYEDGTNEIVTNDFGNIQFIKAEENFKNDSETLDFIKELGYNVRECCHEVSFYLIQRYEKFKAVTSICTKGLENKYYHSFVLDDVNNVIDVTANVIMPKEQYYILQEVKEINCINYKEYIDEKDKSMQFDETGILYNLLRNAVYKQYLNENKIGGVDYD